MAKETRYPKKLRMKLDRVAQNREARERSGTGLPTPEELQKMTPDELFDIASDTLYREFLQKGMVALMGMGFDEQRMQITMMHHINLQPVPDRITALAPWLDQVPESGAD